MGHWRGWPPRTPSGGRRPEVLIPPDRGRSLFINCPFDERYRTIFDAVVFATKMCGFEVRSALEIADSGELRLQKILRLIAATRFSLHDLSRVELDADSSLPRFNMPIELGIALGMKHLGRARLRDHHLLVLDSEPYRYQRFASDLAGVDIAAHGSEAPRAVAAVRDFLGPHAERPLPSASVMIDAYDSFEGALPDMLSATRQISGELTFADRIAHITEFLTRLAGP